MTTPDDPAEPVDPRLDTTDPLNDLDGLSADVDPYEDPLDWETQRKLEAASVRELEAAARDAELQGHTDLSRRLDAEASSRQPVADPPEAFGDAGGTAGDGLLDEMGVGDRDDSSAVRSDDGSAATGDSDETGDGDASGAATGDSDESAAADGTASGSAAWSGRGASVLTGALLGGALGAVGGPQMALAGVALGAVMGWTAP